MSSASPEMATNLFARQILQEKVIIAPSEAARQQLLHELALRNLRAIAFSSK